MSSSQSLLGVRARNATVPQHAPYLTLRARRLVGACRGLAPAARRLSSRSAIVTRSAAGVPCGVATGDVTDGQAIVWSRTDRPARLIVEYSTTPSFADTRRVVGPAALEDTDFTARVDLIGLPAGQRISYRVLFQDLADLRRFSVPVEGSFPDAGAAAVRVQDGAADRDVSFVFSGDCVGQGWGIDPSRGGMRLYDAMRKLQPDVFIHLGDTIYADQPLKPEVVARRRHRSGATSSPKRSRSRRRRSTISAAAIATTCRTSTCGASTPRCRRSRSGTITRCATTGIRRSGFDADPRADVKSVALLAARAKRAFLEYLPLRINPIETRTDLPRLAPRSGARDLRARHAIVSRPELGQPADRAERGVRDPRRRAGRVARARAGGVARRRGR